MRFAVWVLAFLLVLTILASAVLIPIGWSAFGKGAEGERLKQMQASAQYEDGKFENDRVLYNDIWGSLFGFMDKSDYAVPKQPLEVLKRSKSDFDAPQELRVTWLGHSSVIIEIEGLRFLTDPIWGPRTSPYSFVGPMRWYDMPLPLNELPKLDAVLISHDHYDHLDEPTIRKLASVGTKWVAPLGVGAHLEYWGVPKERIVEVDWGDRMKFGAVELECMPARHASGRQVFDQNATLWAGYALLGQRKKVYYSGDTGMFPELAETGKRLGPFDIVMVEVGAYNQAWPDWHMGPEQAVEAHQLLQGKVFVPIHWGMFDLAMHGWTEPVQRVAAHAKKLGVRIQTPKPGQSLTTETATIAPWWPQDVPWKTAEQDPIRATGLE